MTQVQIAYNHEIDIMVKTLHSHPLITSVFANHSVRAQELFCFRNQDSYLSSVQNENPSILEKSMKFQSETEQQSHALLDSPFPQN